MNVSIDAVPLPKPGPTRAPQEMAAPLFLLSIALLASDREPLDMDDRARRQLSGCFVALSDGYTNYDVAGPERGPVVVLVPGISIPRGVFERTIAPLAEAGYRVVTFDLYGRGFSDRPRVRYDAALFNRQIDDLLGALRIEAPVHLVGLASGGLQAMLYAEQRPSRVKSLVLIAPDGVDAPAMGFVRMVQATCSISTRSSTKASTRSASSRTAASDARL